MAKKNEIVEYLQKLNQTEVIKVTDSNKTRRIFKQSSEVFDIFGAEEKGVLNPFNNYTYEWLNTFLYNVIDTIKSTSSEDFEELRQEIQDNILEWADSATDVYTSDLTNWLNDNNDNVYYLTEASEEYGETDGFKNLQIAQYKAIEELFNNALNCLIEDLNATFPEGTITE